MSLRFIGAHDKVHVRSSCSLSIDSGSKTKSFRTQGLRSEISRSDTVKLFIMKALDFNPWQFFAVYIYIYQKTSSWRGS